ncbi:MAG TPA: hypothetical protein VF363_06150 [Candidatus Eisenbacteria bacterium]
MASVAAARTVRRPWQIHALTAIWAIKGFQELLGGVLGTSFYIASQVERGALAGYALQMAVQSVFFSAVQSGGAFFVMTALWLGKRSARPWGIVFALLSEVASLTYLITRPPEFGGDASLLRTVLVASIVNLGIVGFLLFDGRLLSFLGSTRLVGWWAPRR